MNTEAKRITTGKLFEPVQPPRAPAKPPRREYKCDLCGFLMQERECKVICQNCGNRFDCSDLNIYFD